jgi:hypothetical protein
MGKQKEEDWARWSGLVAQQRASGKSVAAFCHDRDLRDWQFYEWKRRLRQADTGKFVAVEVVAADEPSVTLRRSASESSAPIEIRLCQGRSLMVVPGFDASHLRQSLSVLEREA